jgi:hypothetical protein
MTTNFGITDGTTTYNLNSVGGAYELLYEAWRPSLQLPRTSELGGYGVYEPIEEEIPLLIRDASSVDALTHIKRLRDLLDEVRRWNDGEGIGASVQSSVRLTWRPNGSAAGADYQAPILAFLGIDIPARFNDSNNTEIMPVVLRVLRGDWMQTIETTGASSAADQPTVQTRTFASSYATPSPLDVTLGEITPDPSGGYTLPASVLLVADAAIRLNIFEAESFTAGGVFSSVADSTNHARGGNVFRYTPASANTVSSTSWFDLDTGAWDSDNTPTMDVWAAVRNNSTTRNYRVRAQSSPVIEATADYVDMATGPWVAIDTDGTGIIPQIVFLGTLVNRSGHGGLRLQYQVDSVAGSGTLDIDYLVIHGRLNDACMALRMESLDTSFLLDPFRITVEHRALNDPTPRVRVENDFTQVSLGYSGPLPLLTIGDTVVAIWLSTDGTSWRPRTYNDSAQLQLTLTVARNRVFLVPE